MKKEIKYSNTKKEMRIVFSLLVIWLIIVFITKYQIKWLPSSDGEYIGGLSVATVVIFLWVVDIVNWVIWKLAGGTKTTSYI